MKSPADVESLLERLGGAWPDESSIVEGVMRQIEAAPARRPTGLGHLWLGLSSAAARPWNRISLWLGGLTMRQRIAALGGIGVAAILALLLLWGGIDGKPASAMEKMAESIRKAKSFRVKMIVDVQFAPDPGKPPVRHKMSGTVCWLASGLARSDFGRPAPQATGGSLFEPEVTKIDVLSKSLEVIIDHKRKTFCKVTLPKETEVFGPGTVVRLGDFSGQADRDLGVKNIDGKKSHGFEIDVKKIFPGPADAKLMLEVWLDPESNLPLLVEMSFNPSGKQPRVETGTCRLHDFQWNIDLDSQLFDVTPPRGYTDVTLKEPSVAYRVRRFTECLKRYTELTGGGAYPAASTFNEAEATHKDLLKRFGFEYSPKTPPEVSRNENENFKKIRRVAEGTYLIASLVEHINPDAAYYGKTVKPGEKDKVLLRWKLDDGRYQVIFGDLRSETATAERLRVLEGK
jgi:outer membrane lipoprotein-sorting protein